MFAGRWHDTGGRLRGRFITGAWEGVVLNMTSQAWLSSADVDHHLWTHSLVIVVSLPPLNPNPGSVVHFVRFR
jgi:hypothetical protein